MRHKEVVFSDPDVWEKLALTAYPGFRRYPGLERSEAEIAAFRRDRYKAWKAAELVFVEKALTFCEGRVIESSITKLPVEYAAIAISIYARLMLLLERASDIQSGTILKAMLKVLKLGRTCPTLRDELYAQLIRLTRSNPNEHHVAMVWRILSCCLRHFPPSEAFEPFLELFILQTAAEQPGAVVPERCLRLLHESVFRYGYSQVIKETFDGSVSTLDKWMYGKTPMPVHYPQFDLAFQGEADSDQEEEDEEYEQ